MSLSKATPAIKKSTVATKASVVKKTPDKKTTPAKTPAKAASAKPSTPKPRVAKPAAETQGKNLSITKSTPIIKKPAKGNGASPITAEQRYRMICDAAYFRAERRGFIGGNSAEDWAAAEAEIDSLLLSMKH